jgi:hypothetical protein
MTFFTRKVFGVRTLVATSLVCVALLGCGGDGDGDSSSIWDDVLPLAITDANMNAVAGSVIMADTTAGFLPTGGDITVAGVETSSLPSPTRTLVELAVGKAKAAKSMLASQDVVSGVEGSQTFQCLEGGTFTLTFNVASEFYLSVGDVLSFSFNNCSEYVDEILETLDGGMRLTVTSIAGDLNPYGSLGESVVLTNLRLTTPSYVLTSNGSMQINETYNIDDTTDFTYSSAELTYKIVIGSAEYNTRLTNWTTTGVYSVSELGEVAEWETTHNQAAIFPTFTGSFDVSTLVPVVEYLGETGITSGQLEVVGSNSVLYVTFQPGNLVLLELDSDNDKDIDVSRTVPIDDLNPLLAATL